MNINMLELNDFALNTVKTAEERQFVMTCSYRGFDVVVTAANRQACHKAFEAELQFIEQLLAGNSDQVAA